MAKGIVTNTVALPGSAPEVLKKVVQPHDLATMRVDHPTTPSKAKNPALAFAGVTVEKLDKPYVATRPGKASVRRRVLVKKSKAYAGPTVDCPVCGHHVPIPKEHLK